MDLFLLMGVLAVIAIAVYLARRRRRLDELTREDETLSALEDDSREKATAWEESLSDYERDEDDGDDHETAGGR